MSHARLPTCCCLRSPMRSGSTPTRSTHALAQRHRLTRPALFLLVAHLVGVVTGVQLLNFGLVLLDAASIPVRAFDPGGGSILRARKGVSFTCSVTAIEVMIQDLPPDPLAASLSPDPTPPERRRQVREPARCVKARPDPASVRREVRAALHGASASNESTTASGASCRDAHQGTSTQRNSESQDSHGLLHQ